MGREISGGLPGGGSEATPGRLRARPAQVPGRNAAPGTGLQSLGFGGARDGLLFVPTGYTPERPAPLALVLHGAGSNARRGIDALLPLADEAGLLLLAPDARRATWDVISGGYGPDIAFIDRALARVFADYAVDPSHVAAEGFSDGASYALSIGLTNGDLFTHVLAFSPGFMAPAERRGTPRLFLSHGTRDEVLPIDLCSRALVPRLTRAGYDVQYREFDGPHAVPVEIARAGLDWFLGAQP